MGLKLEEILSNGKYYKNSEADKDVEGVRSTSTSKKEEERVYTYDEAIDLTGNGWYNISMLIALALAVQGMALDLFGFTYVVAAARCDLQLSHQQTSFLLSVPMIGSIISSYFHGYISDTRGRKKYLTEILWASFIIACLSAFSPNFTVLAILKLFSTSLSSGVQSISYTLMGESCSVRTKETYILVLTSALMCCFGVFTAHAYFVLGLNFSYDLGFIVFRPWRLLILSLASALGSSAVFVEFFYESPKYLVSADRNEQALDILRKIRKRNGGKGIYPVKKIVLLDMCSARRDDVSFMRSLWDQIAPLFQPPLLQKTLLLFYILAVLYFVNNGLYSWIPILLNSFFDNSTSADGNMTENFCNMINLKSRENNDDCSSVVSFELLIMGIIQGTIFVALNLGATTVAHKKRIAIISVSVFASASCIAMIFVTDKIISIVFFLGVQLNCLAMGMTFCYIIELFPTRYRGMITSLGVMVGRGSGLVGVNMVGAYMFTHCTISLYGWGACAFSGALMALLLPPDKHNKSKTSSL